MKIYFNSVLILSLGKMVKPNKKGLVSFFTRKIKNDWTLDTDQKSDPGISGQFGQEDCPGHVGWVLRTSLLRRFWNWPTVFVEQQCSIRSTVSILQKIYRNWSIFNVCIVLITFFSDFFVIKSDFGDWTLTLVLGRACLI